VVVVEPERGIGLSRVLDKGGGLTKTRGKGSSADLPAEHTGARRLWRHAPVMLGIKTPTTLRVVLLSIDDVAGVAIVGACPGCAPLQKAA